MADQEKILTVEKIQALLEVLVEQLDNDNDADGLEALRDYLQGDFIDDLDSKIEAYEED